MYMYIDIAIDIDTCIYIHAPIHTYVIHMPAPKGKVEKVRL